MAAHLRRIMLTLAAASFATAVAAQGVLPDGAKWEKVSSAGKAFGGEGPNGVFEEMEMYVPTQNRWYELEPLPIAVHGVTGSAFVNVWIHLTGGGTSNGGSSGSTIHQIFWVNGINP